ncbi:MAG: hypothetical protein GDYSWBUE_002157 [Candidatus Fervidibacterota bacterium]
MKRLCDDERVVITGLGCVTPLGIGVEESWLAAINGKSGIGRLTHFDASEYTSQIAGEVKNFDPEQFMDPKEVRKADRFVQFAVASTKMALEDAGIKINSHNADRIGVYIGSGIGGTWTWEYNHRMLLEKGPKGVSPRFVPMIICNMAAGHTAIIIGARGPNLSAVTACASAGHSIALAVQAIKSGMADVMIAGGSEAAISPLAVAGFCSMKALSTRNDEPQKSSRPFDAKRDGFVIAEGAGVVILERLSHAIKRGARIYAEVVGIGFSADAYHVTAMSEDGDGPARAMKMALDIAGLSPTEVDYINAHATSTPQGDKAEVKAIKRVFGEYASKVAVSSTKSMTGHMLGAAGGVELIFTVLAIRDQIAPPTINYEYPDPECDIDCVPNKARHMRIDVAMCNSFGFGGQNAVVVIKRYEG